MKEEIGDIFPLPKDKSGEHCYW